MFKEKVETFVQEEIVSKRKQVGILGGNFNPVHYGHLLIADQVKQKLGLDKVYLMPEYLPPHVDEKETIPAVHRLEMLQLATSDNQNLGIETIELARGGKSYTIDTMRKLKELNPDTDYFFIIGGDMVAYLPKWHEIQELVQLVHFVGVEREGFQKESPYPIIWVDNPKVEFSSSMIRKMFAKNIAPNYLLPKSVIDYISLKGLYKHDV